MNEKEDDNTAYEEMEFEKQKDIFFKSSFAEKGDLLVRSQAPDELANVLSCEEMYLMTRDMDIDARAEILEHANLPQLFFMADLDCWINDQVDAKGFLDWIECLFLADIDKLATWLSRIDYEMLAAGFNQYIQVLKPEHQYAVDEALGDNAYFTLDFLYYVLVDEDNLETVKRALQLLYETNRALYINLLEGLLSELEYEMEEEAFRRRNIRLSERGFPEMDSAMQIYRRMTEEEWSKLPKKELNEDSIREDSVIPANYPVLWEKEKLFLDDVLISLAQEPILIIHSLQEELVWLSNKVLACDGIKLASEAKVRGGIERVRRFVNIGLEHRSDSNVDEARVAVKTTWFEYLFRLGFTQIVQLRDQLDQIVKTYWGGDFNVFCSFLGEAYEEACRGLGRDTPLYFDETKRKDGNSHRDFRTIEEVDKMRKFIFVLGELHELLEKALPKVFTVLKIEAKGVEVGTTMAQLIGTLLAQFVLKKKIIFKEITQKQLTQFFNKAFHQKNKKNFFYKEVLQDFFGALEDGVQNKKDIESFLYPVIDIIESEFREVTDPEEIDPKFLSVIKVT